ncbi:hypothetical protein HMJ29_00790 [Hymenobacter taeanensis]|uniref:GNAT family N-acetyltransferase n=1 Tax=Hymenobacter taeanensis TaxID=2735321 RepID=A0A6M6BC55_9BACT|nr:MULTISPECIES: hypothetical protein [Hymenobacter]QJX45552.1 hypothetical protein HMJ29_00790 [Hymenobacter taeanensis]UOQ81199.1 hypothetical protein MUN83_20730 [Hymenobacter sp. 5414T-23]
MLPDTLAVIPYAGTLPTGFFEVALPSGVPKPDELMLAALFAEEAERYDILFITDYAQVRLVGLFPKEGGEARFGFWESTPAATAAGQAFAALEAEARRRGCPALTGPLDFNTFQRYRLRVGAAPSWGHFDREPTNPVYYPELLKGMGFRAHLTFESRLIRPETVPTVYADKQPLLDALAALPFDFLPLNADTWPQHEAELFELVQAVFGANPAYRPVSEAQFRGLYNRTYAAGLCPYTSVLLRDHASGQLAALSLCQPNYAPLGLAANQPPTFQRDYPRLQAPTTLLAKTVGVHPSFRNRGLMNALGAYGMVHFREWYQQVIFCLMRTDNFSLHFTDGLPAETAHYALYRKEL